MSTDLNEKNKTENETDEYSYKPRNRAKASTKRKNEVETKKSGLSFKMPAIILVAVIAVFVGVSYVLSFSMPKDRVCDNVYINGVSVGGMNEAEVYEAIAGLIQEDTKYTVISADKSTTINASDVQISVNKDATVERAMNIGKSKNIYKNAYYAVKLAFFDEEIGFVPEYNQELLDKALYDFGSLINGVSSGPGFEYAENSMTIIPGTPGQNMDTSVARNQFLNAVGNGITENIEVTLDYAEPQLLNADEMYNEICKPPQDAYFDKDENANVIVVEEIVGVEILKSDLAVAVEKVNAGERATISAKIIQPQKTKAQLEANLFSKTLGKFTSDFSSSSANRAANVTKASNAINDKILMPGETFSYNETIGNPSLANGYKVATVYENGKTVEGVGGGVCQVSSTLYSAVLYADLNIVERHNHSMTVGYVPNGQDATVSYGSLDFKFKNDTQYPVKVSSVVSGRKLTVSIIGGEYEPERKIEITNKTVSVTEPEEKEIPDPTLPEGTRKITSKGKTGYVVDTYKTVYENDKVKSSKKITRSRYRMVPTEVSVAVVDEASQATGSEGVVTDEPIDGSTAENVPAGEITEPDTSSQIPVSGNDDIQDNLEDSVIGLD